MSILNTISRRGCEILHLLAILGLMAYFRTRTLHSPFPRYTMYFCNAVNIFQYLKCSRRCPVDAEDCRPHPDRVYHSSSSKTFDRRVAVLLWRALASRKRRLNARSDITASIADARLTHCNRFDLSHVYPLTIAGGSQRLDHFWDLCRHQVLGFLQTRIQV